MVKLNPFLHSVETCRASRVLAKDGEIGKVTDVYLDGQTWIIRYLVADASDWCGRRSVLIAPHVVRSLDPKGHTISVGISRERVADSPNIDSHWPISRERERAYCDYFGYSRYWERESRSPHRAVGEREHDHLAHAFRSFAHRPRSAPMPDNAGLQSYRAAHGAEVRAGDGPLGRLDDLLFDPRTWTVRQIVVAAGNWYPGERVQFEPDWICEVSWVDRYLDVELRRADLLPGTSWKPGIAVAQS